VIMAMMMTMKPATKPSTTIRRQVGYAARHGQPSLGKLDEVLLYSAGDLLGRATRQLGCDLRKPTSFEAFWRVLVQQLLKASLLVCRPGLIERRRPLRRTPVQSGTNIHLYSVQSD